MKSFPIGLTTFLALTLLCNFTHSSKRLEKLKALCQPIRVEDIDENFREIFTNSLNKVKEDTPNHPVTVSWSKTVALKEQFATSVPVGEGPFRTRRNINFQYVKYVELHNKNGKIGTNSETEKMMAGLMKWVDHADNKDFHKFLVYKFYCVSLSSKDEPVTIPKQPQYIRQTSDEFVFVGLRFTTTLMSKLKLGHSPSRKITIPMDQKLRILAHMIRLSDFLGTIDMKICDYKVVNFALIETEDPHYVFKMIEENQQRYVNMNMIHLTSPNLVSKETECRVATSQNKISPMAFNEKFFSPENQKEGFLVDPYGLSFSFSMMMISMEYLYSEKNTDVVSYLNTYINEYFKHASNARKSEFLSMNFIYKNGTGKFTATQAEVYENFEEYLDYNVNRLTLHELMKKYKEVPALVIANKEEFIDSYLTTNRDYDRDERFNGYNFIEKLFYLVYYNKLKNGSFRRLEKFHTSYSKTLIDFYEQIYPKNNLNVPKDPELVFPPQVMSKLVDYIISVKFNAIMIGIYYGCVKVLFLSYTKKNSNPINYLSTLDKMSSATNNAKQFLLNEFAKLKKRHVIDIVFQVRNGNILIRGFDSLKIILMTSKKVKRVGKMLEI